MDSHHFHRFLRWKASLCPSPSFHHRPDSYKSGSLPTTNPATLGIWNLSGTSKTSAITKKFPQNKNFRYLKWRYWTFFGVGFPLHKPYIQRPYLPGTTWNLAALKNYKHEEATWLLSVSTENGPFLTPVFSQQTWGPNFKFKWQFPNQMQQLVGIF